MNTVISGASCISVVCLIILACEQVYADSCESLTQHEVPKARQHPRVFSPDWLPAGDIKLDKLPDLSSLYVYWWGDSTLRQILASFMIQAHATRLSEPGLYEWLKKCPPQPHRVPWVPPGAGDMSPCQTNEKTCPWVPIVGTGLGKQVNFTWDWKHLMYEDYDRWRIDSWVNNQEPVPDIVIVGPGHHDCKHGDDKVDFHVQQLHSLMRHLAKLPPKTQVLFIDMVPYTAATEKKLCYQRINDAMLDMVTSADEAPYGRTSSAWLFRRSVPMLRSKVPVTTHHGHTVINSVTKFLLSHLACIAPTAGQAS